MLFLEGPRQVGKTTISQTASQLTPNFHQLNWDNMDDQQLILAGPAKIIEQLGWHQIQTEPYVIAFDEIHKYSKWKSFLKGFFDKYADHLKIIVTGSAKLNVFRKGGDSMMGRYFPYRVHPISIAECIRTTPSDILINQPQTIDPEDFEALWTFGGFPKPFLKRTPTFYRRWQQLRFQQLFREDLRDLTRIYEFAQLELLAKLLEHNASNLINYSKLAAKVRVSSETIRSWMETLSQPYYCFTIQPWTKNISRSLLKQPKVYLWDWSLVKDEGARAENFVACHLHKAIHYWNDAGMGEFALHFVRDKEKREVDFLITNEDRPWLLIEVKLAEKNELSSQLIYFHKKLGTEHAFQVVLNLDYVNQDCFQYKKPIIVPAKTLLSQLV